MYIVYTKLDKSFFENKLNISYSTLIGSLDMCFTFDFSSGFEYNQE